MPFHPTDCHVGRKIKERRILCGLSQEKLGQAVGLTFQQIQKYERGANRIGASRMYHLSQVLDVPVSYFFEEMPAEVAGGKAPPATVDDPMHRRETLELVRAYYDIADDLTRKRLYELAKALAKAEGAPPAARSRNTVSRGSA